MESKGVGFVNRSGAFAGRDTMTMDAGRPQTTTLVARAGSPSKGVSDQLCVRSKLRTGVNIVSSKCDDAQARQSRCIGC